MFNLFKLKPGLPAKSILTSAYYLLLGFTILIGVIIIFEGINDPFGELLILLGILILLIVPLTLRVIFGLLLKK